MFSNSDIFVVTGATSGIGKGSQVPSREGSTVIAVECSNKLNKLKQEVNESGKLF